MGMTDMIASFIMNALNAGDGTAELQRNELASSFNCVPSQINYVISTRFTPERGYIVESKRGGGGYIKIRRVVVSPGEYLMHVVNSIGEALDEQTAVVFVKNLYDNGIINRMEGNLMLAAVSSRGMKGSSQDGLRASVLKSMLLAMIETRSAQLS